MISTLAIDDSVSGAAVLTSRSTDGGLTWQNPVTTSLSSGSFYDKNWITCDTWPQSPHYGNCYQEWDDSTPDDEHLDRRRPDLGRAEVPGRQRNRRAAGRPAERQRHRPYEGGAGIRSFRSIDGGATWQSSVAVASVSEHGVAGNLRTSPLPSAEVAGDGKVYVAWQDCSFRSGCTSNDIVYSTSTRRRRVDGQGADPDRPDHQRRRPLHPGLRGRPLDVGEQHAPRARLLLLPGRRLHLGQRAS